MTQEATQLPTTPPLSGADLVTKTNAALQTIATDFYGAIDPIASAWPGSVWADSANGLIKRLNDAGAAWVVEGALFRRHLPEYAEADIPLADKGGDIHVKGKGDYAWNGAAYKLLSVPYGDVDFTIIYPNGGSAGSPANVSINTRYVETNPFPGHFVICQPEIQLVGRWFVPGWATAAATTQAWGVSAASDGTELVVQTGITGLSTGNSVAGGTRPSSIPGDQTTPCPCRVKVWKVKGAI